jgi:hypothetical protein
MISGLPTDHSPDVIRANGPLDGLHVRALEGETKYVTFFEDFNHRLADLTSTTLAAPNDFTRSNWALTRNPPGTALANSLVRCNHSSGVTGDLTRAETSSLLVITPGSVANTGINARHTQQGALAGTPSSLFEFVDINPGLFGDREVFWATSLALSRDSGTAWDCQFAVGLSRPDTQLMVDTSGALTNWVDDGGFLFHNISSTSK